MAEKGRGHLALIGKSRREPGKKEKDPTKDWQPSQWDDAVLKKTVRLIPKTKNEEPLRIPLSPEALRLLFGLPRRIDGNVRGIRPDSITQAFLRALTRVRVSDEKGIRGEEGEAASGLPGKSHLPRIPARGHKPLLREGREPHSGGDHCRPQDVTNDQKVNLT